MTNRKFLAQGTSGTDISGGMIFEEYLNKLLSTSGADIYDEMRRSDDQVAMLLRVVKNPIMSARWFVIAASEDETDKKISDFIQHILFDDLGTEENPKTFEKFKKEALTSVEFGYSLFELTNKIVLESPKFGQYIGLKNIGWRSPRTIEEWKVAKHGDLLAVRQTDNSERAQDVWLDGRFLLHIAPDMEGDNYEGISMLRPIYGNFIRKQFFNKIKMIGSERAAIGVPIGQIPQGQINSTSQSEFEDVLRRFSAHEQQYLLTTEGYTVESFKIDFKPEEIQNIIKAEDVGMAKSFLANFMELGLNGSGSFALGTDLSDIFLSGIEVYANAILSAINSKLIPWLVRLNFGRQVGYPKMKIEGINDKAGKEYAEILKLLGESGIVQLTDELKEIVHQKYKLPFDKDFSADSEFDIKNKTFTNTQLAEKKLQLAEKNVSKTIENYSKKLFDLMKNDLSARGQKLVAKMMKIYSNAPKSQRMKQVNQLVVPGKNEYKKQISSFLADIYVDSTKQVKSELSNDGLKLAESSEVQALPLESKAAGASQADLIVESQDADLRKNLFFSFTANADKLPTAAQMEANLLAVVEKYVDGASVRAGAGNAASQAVNLARNAVYQEKTVFDGIESFIFQNPSPDAAICKELAGRVFSKQEYVVSSMLPPLHHNCNSFIVAQTAGAKGNKPLSPAGLSIQGSDSEIERIQKSITL